MIRTHHFEYQSVGIMALTDMAVGMTLADKPIPKNIAGLFAQWVKNKEGWMHDERPDDMEIVWIDIMPVSPDGFYFSVEGEWFIEDESSEEREADNRNDQAWIDARDKS